jgi:hypothetical protein
MGTRMPPSFMDLLIPLLGFFAVGNDEIPDELLQCLDHGLAEAFAEAHLPFLVEMD